MSSPRGWDRAALVVIISLFVICDTCDDNNELAISFADHSVRLLISFSLFSRLQKATYTCDENNEMATSFLIIVFVCTSVFRPTIVCKGLLLRFNTDAI